MCGEEWPEYILGHEGEISQQASPSQTKGLLCIEGGFLLGSWKLKAGRQEEVLPVNQGMSGRYIRVPQHWLATFHYLLGII